MCFTHSVFVRDGVLVKTWQVFSGPQICDRVIYVCNLSSDTTPLLPLTAIIIVGVIIIPVVMLIIFIIIKTQIAVVFPIKTIFVMRVLAHILPKGNIGVKKQLTYCFTTRTKQNLKVITDGSRKIHMMTRILQNHI